MTKPELQDKLKDIGIKPSVYSLDGGVYDDKYVLSQEAMGKWAVYYSERGIIIGKRIFDNENTACEYFLHRIQSDPTVKLKKR